MNIIELGAALEHSAKIELNADLYAIGGVARDFYMGLPSNDLDMECFGDFTLEEFEAWAMTLGPCKRSGRKFPVWRVSIDGNSVELSIPRTDNLIGEGHYDGFEFTADPQMSFLDAVQRRDYTCNAMLLRCSTLELIDPTGWGMPDITNNRLVHVSDKFSDDTLRVLRGMQQAARLDFHVLPDTAYLCSTMGRDFHTISPEAQWHEWEKWGASTLPGNGLCFLQCVGWTPYYPGLHKLIGCLQDPEHHPEGDAWRHTLYAVNAAARQRYESGCERLVVVFAALCHDLGKPSTTEFNEDGRLTSYSHNDAGVPLAENFLKQIGAPDWLIAKVLPLVREHMWPIFMRSNKVTPRSVRRLSNRLSPASIREWIWVLHADSAGRPGRDDAGEMSMTALRALIIARKQNIDRQAPKDILMGRHMLELGQVPGKHIGEFLRRAKEAQLDGEFTDLEGALEWAKEQLQ